MKRLFSLLVTLMAIITVAPVEAGWVLYDDFDTGIISPEKWNVDNSSAAIGIQDGKVKFVHKPGFANDSSSIQLKASQPIKGIRAKVFVQSMSGDLRARIGSYIGKTGKNEDLWQQIAVRQDQMNICGAVSANDSSGWLYDVFYVGFRYPNQERVETNPVLKKWFTMTSDFSALPRIGFSVNGQGSSTFKLPITLLPGIIHYQIGTKSNSGSGSGTVYFDDVFILQ